MTAASEAFNKKFKDSLGADSFQDDTQGRINVVSSERNNPEFAADSPYLERELAGLRARLGSGGGGGGGGVPPGGGIALDSPEAKALLAQSDAQRSAGALSQVAQVAAPQQGAPTAPPGGGGGGALSQVSDSLAGYKMPTIDEVLNRYIPQDSSSDRYLAMAAGLGRPTGFGSFGEKMANVADAVQTQKLEQQKLRMQYLPAIMQQVASQQQMMFEMQGSVNAGANLLAANQGQPQGLVQQGQPGGPPQGATTQGQPQSAGPQGGQPPAWNPAEHGGLLKPIPEAELNLIKTLPFKDRAKAYQEIAQRYTTPSWKDVDGNMINTNDGNFRGGIQPGVSMSTSGQAMVRSVGPNGQVTVAPANGAVAAQRAFLDTSEDSKAQYDLVDVPDGRGGIIKMPRSQALQILGQQRQGPAQTAPPPGVPAQGGNGPNGAPQSGPSGAIGTTPSPIQMKAAEARATGSEAAGQAYQNVLHDKVESDFMLVNRNKQIEPLLNSFSTGGLAPEERIAIGNTIQNSGMLPKGMADKLGAWVAGGDPAVGKTLENQLAAAGISTLLQTLDKEGKPNRAEFQVINDAKESIKSGNATLRNMFELQKRLYDVHFQEQQALTSAVKTGEYNPATWAGDYSAIRHANMNKPPAPLPSQAPHAVAADALVQKYLKKAP